MAVKTKRSKKVKIAETEWGKTLKLGKYFCPACQWTGMAVIHPQDKTDRCPKCNYFAYPVDEA